LQVIHTDLDGLKDLVKGEFLFFPLLAEEGANGWFSHDA